jgi:hypothetical protein
LREPEFIGQAKQVDSDVAPTPTEYFPAPQSLQVVDPVTSLYFPATHGTHASPSSPDEPVLQVQEGLPARASALFGHAKQKKLANAPTDAENLPRSQSLQSVSSPDLYFPAEHSVHVPPAGPDEPALQMQSVKVVLPWVDIEFSGHAEQKDAVVAPTAPEYFPHPQSLQAAVPGTFVVCAYVILLICYFIRKL